MTFRRRTPRAANLGAYVLRVQCARPQPRFPSEREPQPQLNQPGQVHGRGDNPELRSSQRRARIGKLHAVEQIEEFRAEFEFELNRSVS
jgi:hypothetical protein